VGWATGTAAYLAAVVLTLARFRPARVRVEIDGVGASLDAMLVAVANGTSYGGGMRIAPKASPRDGLLDVVAIEAMGRGEFVRNFASVFRGEHIRHPNGEVVSRTPVAFGVRKGGVVMRLA
jgi:diacylglycerol kinase (ATP)